MSASDPSGAAVRCAIVIVNYNGRDFVADAVRSALAQTVRRGAEASFPVVVVDNASTDGSLEALAPFAGDITLIASPDNTGFAGGNNLAFARFASAQTFALLNPDAVADPDWLAELLACAGRHADWGFVAGHVRNAAAPEFLDNVGHRMALDGTVRGRGRGERDSGQYTSERPLFIGSGCALLVRGQAIAQVGGFDDAFFCYGDDVELCLRLHLHGFSGWFAPAAKVAHRFSATAAQAFSAFKAYHVERNRYWVIAKCFPPALVPVALAATAARYAASVLALAKGRGPGARLAEQAGAGSLAKTLLKAHVDAVRGLPRVLAQRRTDSAARVLATGAFVRRWRADYLPMRVAVTLE